jgi:hypothetical protein
LYIQLPIDVINIILKLLIPSVKNETRSFKKIRNIGRETLLLVSLNKEIYKRNKNILEEYKNYYLRMRINYSIILCTHCNCCGWRRFVLWDGYSGKYCAKSCTPYYPDEEDFFYESIKYYVNNDYDFSQEECYYLYSLVKINRYGRCPGSWPMIEKKKSTNYLILNNIYNNREFLKTDEGPYSEKFGKI